MRWYTSYVLRGASPGARKALRQMNAEIDIRGVLPTISVPTLVLYRADENYKEATRFMGERIPGARVVELVGSDHLPWEGDRETLLDEIERFLAVRRDEAEPDRVLATMLFTDIAGSTAKAAEIGDRAWSELLERYLGVARAQLARFRGSEVDTAGDGLFATFDGPARAVRCASAIINSVRISASKCEPASTPARSSDPTRTCAESPSTSARASRRRQIRARCSCRARSRTSSPVRASTSRSAESTSLRVCPAPGGCSPPRADAVYA